MTVMHFNCWTFLVLLYRNFIRYEMAVRQMSECEPFLYNKLLVVVAMIFVSCLGELQWIVLSSDISNSDETRKNLVFCDFQPATWYQLKVSAVNDAGKTTALYNVATTKLNGGNYNINYWIAINAPRLPCTVTICTFYCTGKIAAAYNMHTLTFGLLLCVFCLYFLNIPRAHTNTWSVSGKWTVRRCYSDCQPERLATNNDSGHHDCIYISYNVISKRI